MAVLARWQSTITDEKGNIVPQANIEVHREGFGNPLATIYDNRDGAGSPLSNPFQADNEAFAFFHVTGGEYYIKASKGSFSRIYRYVAIGTAAGTDKGTVVNPRGAWSAVTAYAVGDLVSHTSGGEPYAFVSNTDGNTNHEPPFTSGDIGTSNSFWTVLGLIESPGEPGLPGSSDVVGTSVTSVAIGTGSKSFTIAETDRGWGVGARLRVTSNANPTTHFMEGVVASYIGTSLDLTVDLIEGSGSRADWTINLAGQRGSQGDAATITVGTVTTGAPGSPADVDNVGTPQAAVFNFTIPEGDKGDTGDAATITVGTVTTVSPGTPADVDNVGTPQAAIFNFSIPQGDAGTNGTNGTDPGILLNWDDQNTDSDPGAGNIRANNDALGSATVLYVSKTNRSGSDISAFLLSLDDSSNLSRKGGLILTRSSDDVQAFFAVTGVTDASGYVKVAVSSHSGATGFTDTDPLSFQFSRDGDKGTDGIGAGDMTAAVYDPNSVAGDAFDMDNMVEGSNTKIMTSAERTKVGFIAITQSVDLDALESKLANITITQPVDLDAMETKLAFITVTQAVDLDAMETRVNELDAAVILKGTWAANAGTFPGSGAAQAGWSYIVSVAGTVDSVVFAVGDRIIAITDNASTSTFSGNWFKADYTDLVSSVAGKTGAVTLVKGDVGLGNVDNTTDLNKPISTATQTALDAKASRTGYDGIQDYSTSSSIVLADMGKLVKSTSAGSMNLTLPSNSTTAIAIGSHFQWTQYGAGALSFVAGAGATIISYPTGALTALGQYAGGTVVKTNTNEWLIIGGIKV